MVKSILSLINTRQNNILSGASILMFAVFASKFLGLVRDRLLVHTFNTSQTDIFLVAFRLPDMLFQLLIFGAISVAFIPIYIEHLNTKGEKDAHEFASNILNLSVFAFGVVVFIAWFFVPQLNTLFAPGFKGEQKVMTDILTRYILIGQLFLVIGSFFIAFSQAYQRFIFSALAPLFYNLGIIFGITVLTRFFGLPGAAMGAAVGGLLHAAIQLPLVKSLGFKYKFSFNFLDRGVRQIFKMMSIRNIGLAFEQLNETVATSLSTTLSYGAVTQLTFAQHLQVVPIGLFGATIAQAALPVLSNEQAKKEVESFKMTLLTTLHQILFLTLPAAAILIVLRIPVVRLVFGAAQFNWEDTVLTGRTVAFLSLGLVAQSVILLLVRGFYAFKDTKTPVLVSIITVLVNIALSFVFINMFREVWVLGISYAVSSNLSLVLLLYFLNKKVGGFNTHDLLAPAGKMVISALVAALALYIPIKALDQLVFDTTKTVNLIVLTGIASIFGLGIYLILVWLWKVRELESFINLIKKLGSIQTNLKSKEVIEETTTPV